MTLGGDRKKLVILVGLVAVAAWVFLSSGSDDRPAAATTTRPAAVSVATPEAVPATTARALPGPNIQRDARRPVRGGSRGTIQEFRPTLKPRRAEDRVDPTTVDPTLRLDLLAKLGNVKSEGGMRSLFEFSQPPAPKVPDVKIAPKPIVPVGPQLPKEADNKPPTPPKPIKPIPLKFYGFSNPIKQGAKRAFFLDGEEIFVASEGEVIKKKYQVVRIGVNSVVVKDIEQDSQQTLPLVEEQQG